MNRKDFIERDIDDFDDDDDIDVVGITTGAQLEDYYSKGFRNTGAGYLRFILMAFVCFWNYGFPEPTGIVSAISGFAIPCFYILSGYFILPSDMELSTKRTVRKIKRSALCMAFMFLVYLLINIIVCVIKHISVKVTKRVIFNFLVLNLWPLPIGSNIWFIQAMLYAYIVILIAHKLGMMKFYKPVLIITLIIMLLTGEFAGLIHFNVLGYNYIPGNWLTRALPYILIGKLIRDNEDRLLKSKMWKCLLITVVGALLAIGEIVLLGKTGLLVYEGHMIGYGVMAVAVCCMALSKPMGHLNPITYFDTELSGVIYLFIEPIYYALGLIAGKDNFGLFAYFGGIAAYLVCIMLAFAFKNSRLIKAFFA